MKHLKKFETTAAFEALRVALDLPNVSLVEENYGIQFLPYVEQDPYNEHDYSLDYLTLVAINDGEFSFADGISYSIDNGETWSDGVTPTITSGNKVLLKGNIETVYPTSENKYENDNPYGEIIGSYYKTVIMASDSYSIEGNVMSLFYEDNFVENTSSKWLPKMFINDTHIVDASNLVLPATTLTDIGCYSHMFEGCTSLTTAPKLPATTLTENCYEYMFYGCTSLTTAPELPATTLTENCYYNMFGECTALTTAPELPATTLASACYDNMFYDCTSLTTAPELPATTLVDLCYQGMFENCTSLNYVKCLATDISASDCINLWLDNVASNGTFVKNANMSSWTTGNSGIPSGWTAQDA